MSNHKRGPVLRLPAPSDPIVRVYQEEPDPLTLDGMTVSTAPLTTVIDAIPLTVWARVIRPALKLK